MRRRVVDHFVQDHAAAVGQGERGFVGEFHTDGTKRSRFDHIALINRVTDLEFDLGPVGPGRIDLAGDGDDLADRFGRGGGTRLGFDSGSGRAGQLDGQRAVDDGPVRGDQIRGISELEEAFDKDFGSVLADKQKVRSLADEFGG